MAFAFFNSGSAESCSPAGMGGWSKTCFYTILIIIDITKQDEGMPKAIRADYDTTPTPAAIPNDCRSG